MPKMVDHEERKRMIAELALELFAQRGYYAVSFGEIADTCGLSRTNVYNYFTNKDEIFHYAVSKLLDTITKKIELIIRSQELSLAQKLQEIYHVFTNDVGEGKYTSIILDLALRLKRENTHLAKALEEDTKALRNKIEMLFAGEASLLPSSQTRFATTLFFSLVESSIMHSLFTDGAFIQNNIGSILHILGT